MHFFYATRNVCVRGGPRAPSRAQVGLVERVTAEEEQEKGGEAAKDRVALLPLGPGVGAEAIGLVVLEAGDLDDLGLEERPRRAAVRAHERVGHQVPRRQLRDHSRDALLELVAEVAGLAHGVAGLAHHEFSAAFNRAISFSFSVNSRSSVAIAADVS